MRSGCDVFMVEPERADEVLARVRERLLPETVLDAVEAAGVAVRPLCYPLNSFENRVYEVELADRLAVFEKEGKLLEAQRLRMRTEYDLEMLREVGFCNGVENYSAPMEGRGRGGAEHAHRLLPQGLPDDHRRVAPDHPAAARPV